MSPREQLLDIADRYPWVLQEDTQRRLRMFRWCRCGPSEQHRHEYVVLFDLIGRIECWSEWRNYRINIDPEPGLRQRLLDAIAKGER